MSNFIFFILINFNGNSNSKILKKLIEILISLFSYRH
jgi:hypothetical protein